MMLFNVCKRVCVCACKRSGLGDESIFCFSSGSWKRCLWEVCDIFTSPGKQAQTSKTIKVFHPSATGGAVITELVKSV